METTDIVVKNQTIIRSVDDLGRIGKMMAASGYFTDARDAAQAAVKIQAGMEMGFGPFASMTGIYIIQGRPSVGANLMASAVKSNPKYDYRVRANDGKECAIEFFERVDGKLESLGTSSFTIDEARKAGVKNLDKFPRNMLFARAMSNGIRWYCPDVFSGNPTYTPEELGASVDDEGYVTELPKAEVQAQPVIEAEVINPEPAPKKADSWDEAEYLRNFTRPDTVLDMHINTALSFTAADGTKYGDLSTKELRGHLIGLWKSLKDPSISDNRRDEVNLKIAAICAIIRDRKLKAVPEPNGGRPDPFVGK